MTLVSAEVRVGYLPNPYDLDGACIDGLRIGAVEKLVMYEPDSDRLGPYIRAALRETFEVELREAGEGPDGGHGLPPSSTIVVGSSAC